MDYEIEYENIGWKELHGNKFVKGINPYMLRAEGYEMVQLNQARLKEQRKLVYCHYDAEYVKEYYYRKIIKPLAELSLDQLTAFSKDALSYAAYNYPGVIKNK